MSENQRRLEARLLPAAEAAYSAARRVESVLPDWDSITLTGKRHFVAAVRQVMRESTQDKRRGRLPASSKPISGVSAADIMPLAEHARSDRYAAGSESDTDKLLLASAGFAPG